jgi:hypothetical protein
MYVLNLFFAAVLGFASIVEWSHMRTFMRRADWRVVTTAMAAIACGYMASEALEGRWPSWESTKVQTQ